MTYADGEHPALTSAKYYRSREDHLKVIKTKEKRARDFRISLPWLEGDLRDWLNTEIREQDGEAAVRDSDESIEVVVVRAIGDGQIAFLPWVEAGRLVDTAKPPHSEVGQALARCTIRLPSELCKRWNLDQTIEQLESQTSTRLSAWQRSPWLSGQLFLILDTEHQTTLNGYRLEYDRSLGLICIKEGDNTVESYGV